ncbi:MAG: single-stranded DNA-binding protein [Microbacterium sp.]|uniref:single-stranded DNA-binding protein n=1 Tax=Microbacterium sp. TaxID=51671 RepID=UPI001AD25103|nr:single-stranded DNA-binding protein [Microbacterium sp.]MBN9176276.1 single-stranded DNA-binding protein [Microbacterium sp.]
MTDTISITGNLTSAPERIEVAGGVTMVRFGLASTERRLDGGVWTDVHTNYYNVAVFRKLAEHAYRSLERGQRVIVVGKLKVRPWESNGRTGTSMDLEASSLGPDLMFGVATFTKTTRLAGQGEAPAPEPEPEPEPSWAAPGAADAVLGREASDSPSAERGTTTVHAQQDEGSAGASSEASGGELVGAAGWGAPADAEQTPF